MPVVRKIEAFARMSVYGCHGHVCGHRTTGDIDPKGADMLPDGLGENESSPWPKGFCPWPKGEVAHEMLSQLQKAGVMPGARLKITIEEIPPEEKK